MHLIINQLFSLDIYLQVSIMNIIWSLFLMKMYIPCVRHYIENSINLIVVIRYIQETPFYLSIKPFMVYKMCGRHPWKKKHNNVLLYFDLRINKHQMYFDVIFWESCPSFKALQRPIETFKNYQNHSNRIEQY